MVQMVTHTLITWIQGYRCKLMKDVFNKNLVMYDPYLQLMKEKKRIKSQGFHKDKKNKKI
jgi:hypothetical protein